MRRQPSARSQGSPDIVIVGAGVIGLAIAWQLRDSGARILVLDRQRAGQGASWAGGGILSPLPPGQCDPRVEALLHRSLTLYPEWCAALHDASGIDPQFWRCGAHFFSSGGIQEFPDIAQVRNPRLLQSAVAAVRSRGIEIRENVEVIGWDAAGGQLTGVQLGDGNMIPTQKAVLCAGAWSGALGVSQVRPIKGEMLLYRGEPGALSRILIGESIYVIPRRDGRVLVGSTLEDAGFDMRPSAANREMLHQAARVLWPEIEALELERQWCGLRPGSSDGIPVIGPLSKIDGLLACTGHFRIGLTLAPASAELCESLLLGNSVH